MWHDGLWQVLGNFGIEEGLIQTTEAMYMTSSGAVLLKSQVGDYYQLASVRADFFPKRCSISFLRISCNKPFKTQFTISIECRIINNLSFADGIELSGGSNSELKGLTNRQTDRQSRSIWDGSVY